jgi:hypothetical protein
MAENVHTTLVSPFLQNILGGGYIGQYSETDGKSGDRYRLVEKPAVGK